MFSSEFWKISTFFTEHAWTTAETPFLQKHLLQNYWNTFFTEHAWTTASEYSKLESFVSCNIKIFVLCFHMNFFY